MISKLSTTASSPAGANSAGLASPGDPRRNACASMFVAMTKAMNHALFATMLSVSFAGIAFADDDAHRDMIRQRVEAATAEAQRVAKIEHGTLVLGSLRLHSFGPEVTIAFYSVSTRDRGTRQYMMLIETMTDTARGEAAPPIRTANLVARRYATKQVAVANVAIGGDGWRTLESARATIHEDPASSSDQYLATVTLPLADGASSVRYRVSHCYCAKPAQIVELQP